MSEKTEARGGWASQSIWLKAVLVLSLALIVVGVVRCSFESTEPVAQAVDRVAVMPVAVDVPEGFFPAPPDSVAIATARWFARSFAKESGVSVEVVASRERVPEVAAEGTDFEGLVYFELKESGDRLLVHGEMIHSGTRRPMATVDYDIPPSFLFRRITEAGVEMAASMGYDEAAAPHDERHDKAEGKAAGE
ncbi:hypothetical protein H8D73_02185 [bacterium]|nr:hypothetical protein [bacterium]